MKRSIYLILVFVLLAGTGHLIAQDISAVDSLFNQGVKLYKKGQYQNVLNMMELMDRVYPDHNRTTGSLLMQGKALYKLNEYKKSLKRFGDLVKNYNGSDYQDDALYGIATVFYNQKLYQETVVQLMMLVDRGGDNRLLRKAAQLSSSIMDNLLETRELKELLTKVEGEKGKAAVTLRLAQREIKDQHYQSAKRILQEYLDLYPNGHYVYQMEQLLSEADKKGKGLVKIGVILPITGPYAGQGTDLWDGIQYAVDLHNKGTGADVELIFRDSKSRIVEALKAAQELCENEEIIAVIGELEGNISAGIAAITQLKGIPLLAPTTTLDDITSIGPMVFQMNPNRLIQGEKLAEYAVSGLGLKKFAILAPATEYGEAMRSSFTETVNNLGGEILAEQWYFEEGAEQLRAQFKEIRKAGILRMMEDSLVVQVDEDEWDDMYADRPMQDGALFVKQTIEELVDSTSLAVTSIDGVFMPVRSQDLQFVMPQYASFNFESHLFGGSYWNEPELLENNRRYIDGVYFISEYYIDTYNYSYTRFRDQYRLATNKTPEMMDVLGYDTANLLLSIAGEMAISRTELKTRLDQIDQFSGIHGFVSFNDDRINHKLSLLQYLGGKIIKIK